MAHANRVHGHMYTSLLSAEALWFRLVRVGLDLDLCVISIYFVEILRKLSENVRFTPHFLNYTSTSDFYVRPYVPVSTSGVYAITVS